MSPVAWHLITGEYPPQLGGVADYTATLAKTIAPAVGEVHVWCPGDGTSVAEDGKGVFIHRVCGRFGLGSLVRLGRELNRFPGPRTIVLQYVPHGFGYKAMNLLFVVWVVSRRLLHRDDVRVLFHEVAYPWVRWPLHHNLIAAVTRVMASVLIRSCTRAYVSIPAWIPLLKRLGAGRKSIVWTPIPSNVPTQADAGRVAARRTELGSGPIVGHFGTYGPLITEQLGPALRLLLKCREDIRLLLLGAGSERWRNEVCPTEPIRVIAAGPRPAAEVAEYLRACDLVIQPFPDGASSRRTSLMAPLANGVPVVTTLGVLSEPIWSNGAVVAVPVGDPEQLAVKALELLDHPDQLAELGDAGRELYEEQFAIGRTVATLLSDSPTRATC